MVVFAGSSGLWRTECSSCNISHILRILCLGLDDNAHPHGPKGSLSQEHLPTERSHPRSEGTYHRARYISAHVRYVSVHDVVSR